MPKPDGLVFPGELGGPLRNRTRWSAKMEQRLGFEVFPHALRRTSATRLGDCAVPPHIVEVVLGHRKVGGDLHAGYNSSRYALETAHAMQRLGDRLDLLEVGGENVVEFRALG